MSGTATILPSCQRQRSGNERSSRSSVRGPSRLGLAAVTSSSSAGGSVRPFVVGWRRKPQELWGYAFVFEPGINEYRGRPELRMGLFWVGETGFIVTKLPAGVGIASLQCHVVENRLVITDGAAFKLEINEFGNAR